MVKLQLIIVVEEVVCESGKSRESTGKSVVNKEEFIGGRELGEKNNPKIVRECDT